MSSNETKCRVIVPPESIDFDDPRPLVFLSGSFENTSGEPWRQRVIGELADTPVVLLNPQREDWDSSFWNRDEDDPQFDHHLSWSFDALAYAEMVAFYFDPQTKSPVSLLELGLVAAAMKMSSVPVVCCPPGFYRRASVQKVCELYTLNMVNTLEELIADIRAFARRGEGAGL